jgi:hypothetical protein
LIAYHGSNISQSQWAACNLSAVEFDVTASPLAQNYDGAIAEYIGVNQSISIL